MKKNGFLTFVTACIPGFGQMYYGCMRRGLSIGFWFYLLFALATFFNFPPLFLFLPLIWAYSFFDTFNIRALTAEQYAALNDAFVPDGVWFQALSSEKMTSAKSRKYIGWAFIVFGGFFLYNAVMNNAAVETILYRIPILAIVVQVIPGVLIGIVVIIVGVSMLRGKKPEFINQLDEAIFSEKSDVAEPGNENTAPPFSLPVSQSERHENTLDSMEDVGEDALQESEPHEHVDVDLEEATVPEETFASIIEGEASYEVSVNELQSEEPEEERKAQEDTAVV